MAAASDRLSQPPPRPLPSFTPESEGSSLSFSASDRRTDPPLTPDAPITEDFLFDFCRIYGIRPEWLRPAPAGETPAPPPPAR